MRSKRITGDAALDLVLKRLDLTSDEDIIRERPGSKQWIKKLRQCDQLSSKDLSRLFSLVQGVERRKYIESWVTPIVEMFPVWDDESKSGKYREIFVPKDDDQKKLPYLEGLRQSLKGAKGVYVFYDSRGRALYVGKTKTCLWAEIKSAYNRVRSDQSIYLTPHPDLYRTFNPATAATRRIHKKSVQLNDLATYFSAYRVEADLVDKVEALLIRTFPNDLLNIKVETVHRRQH